MLLSFGWMEVWADLEALSSAAEHISLWLEWNDRVQIIETFLEGGQSPFASTLREKEKHFYVAWGMLVVYVNDVVNRLCLLMTLMNSFLKYKKVKKVGQTSVETTRAFDKSACRETRFDFCCDVPSVSFLSKLIQAQLSFKIKAAQERAGEL